MKNLRRWSKSLYRIAVRPFLERAISRMCSDTDNDVHLVGLALHEALNSVVSSKEKIWIDRIEALRKDLNSSNRELSIIDYGAGDQNLNLSEESMNKGRYVIRTVDSICRTASMSYLGSLLLFKLIRNFKPENCVEMGTCLGISAAYEAAALSLNGSGLLVTMEGAEALASSSKENFDQLGLKNIQVITGRFLDTLDQVLHANKPIDYMFIDGHHDERATVSYFLRSIPFLSDKSLLIFDDISWTQGMKRAWNEIKGNEKVCISFELKQIGICLIDKKKSGKKHWTIPYV